MKAIVYTSNTGHTEKYAKMLSEITGLPAYRLLAESKVLKKGSEIIYLGWLFASSVKGYKKAAKFYNIKAVVGVGLCDTGCMLEEVRKAISLPEDIPLFTVQGGIDKPRLRGINKFMIDTLIKMMNSKKEKTAEDLRMIELLNSDADYVSGENLKAVLEWCADKTSTNEYDECLICGAPLTYSENESQMECALCHKKEHSKTACENGHYVCNECHTQGIDTIIGVCMSETSKNPIKILRKLMDLPFCHMHGPEHHIMVGSALLTAYKNAGGEIDLQKALVEMQSRGKKVPGGACGFWGACGAGVSAGMFVSIVTGSTPLGNEAWGLSNMMTSRALGAIGEIGGPRCCKRDSYLAVTEAVKFAKTHLGVEMELGEIKCIHSGFNNQCIGNRCPFYDL